MAAYGRSLLAWANTFAQPARQSLSKCDSQLIAQITRKIFPDCTVNSSSPDMNRRIIKLCSEVVEKNLFEECDLDHLESVGNRDAVVAQMFKYLLYAAVKSERCEEFIRGIMDMEKSVQMELMTMLKECDDGPAACDVSQRATIDYGEAAHTTSPEAGRVRRDVSTPMIARHNEQVAALKRDLAQTKSQLEEATLLHDEVVREIRGKNKQIDDLTFRLNDAISAQTRLTEVEDELDMLKGIEARFQRQEAELTRYRQHAEETKEQVAKLAKLEREHRLLQSERDKLVEYSETYEGRMSEYRKQLQQLGLEATEHRLSVERKDMEIARLVEARDRATTENAALRVEVNSLQMRLQYAESTAAERQSLSVTESLKELQAELERMRKENAGLKENLALKTDALSQSLVLSDRLGDSQAILESLRARISEQEQTIVRLTQEKSDLVKHGEESIQRMQAQYDALQEQLVRDQQQMKELQKAFDDAQVAIKTVTEQETAISTLRQELQRKTAALDVTTRDFNTLSKQLRDANAGRAPATAAATACGHETEMADLRRDLKNKETMLALNTKEMNVLIQRLATFQKEAEDAKYEKLTARPARTASPEAPVTRSRSGAALGATSSLARSSEAAPVVSRDYDKATLQQRNDMQQPHNQSHYSVFLQDTPASPAPAVSRKRPNTAGFDNLRPSSSLTEMSESKRVADMSSSGTLSAVPKAVAMTFSPAKPSNSAAPVAENAAPASLKQPKGVTMSFSPVKAAGMPSRKPLSSRTNKA